jgi:uncharacterized protein YjbI with pentapeptide repeats
MTRSDADEEEFALELKELVSLLQLSTGKMNTFDSTEQVEQWNEWRRRHRDVRPCLDNVDFSGLNLSKANFREASLEGANLSRCRMVETDFVRCHLAGSNLSEAYLYGALLDQADLTSSILRNATLWWVTLVETVLSGADLSGSAVYGVSPWNVSLEGAIQTGLLISRYDEATLTVDDLEVAHFMHLLVNNPKITQIVNATTSKVVLILGRFAPERKVVLQALREGLRDRDHLPVVFDFEKPTDRNFTEVVLALAGLAKFIIADLTQPKSSPLESHATITNYMIPFIPIVQAGEWPFSMLVDLQQRDWVERTLRYEDKDDLVRHLPKIIERADAKRSAIQVVKARPASAPVAGEDW